jgi:hypothetical protein
MSKVMCGFCDHEFDRSDKRAYIPKDREADARCPYCCQMTLRGTEMWAVWNSCNGIFEVTSWRQDALAIIEEAYSEHETVVPVRVFVDHEDRNWQRHAHEDEREIRWRKREETEPATESPHTAENSEAISGPKDG